MASKKSIHTIQDALMQMGHYAVSNYQGATLYTMTRDSPKGPMYDAVVTGFQMSPDPSCCGHTRLHGFIMDYSIKKEQVDRLRVFFELIPFLPAAPFITWTLSALNQKTVINIVKDIKGIMLLHEWTGAHNTNVLMFGCERVGAAALLVGGTLTRPGADQMAKYLK